MTLHSWHRKITYLTAPVLVTGLLLGLAAGPATAAPPGDTNSDRSVPVSPFKPKIEPLPRTGISHTPKAPIWPSAASAVVDVPAAAMRIGGLPITLSPVVSDVDFPGARAAVVAEPAPAKVRIEVLDHALSRRAGAPVAFKLSRADGGTDSAKIRVGVDFSAFRDAFGGAYAARLGLRVADECALRAVDGERARQGACASVELDSLLDFRNGTVAANVDLGKPQRGLTAESGGMVVMLASSGDAKGVGTFGKTDLKESGTWAVGGNSGNFSYSYPLATPPVPGNLTPRLSLNYSSATVDGQTAAEHIQNGPLGEGWALAGGGFIERTFRPCASDNSSDHPATWTNATGDPCWRYDNFQLSWSGRSGELVPTGTANVWRVASDDGAKVEYLPSSGSWRVTTVDGVQYNFGLQRLPGWTSGARETQSQLTVEMFANHSGEPCFHSSGYAYSHCTMTYRWLLDYVVDPRGNSMSYWYDRLTNLSGSNNSGQPVFAYHRDALLNHIEYGTRAGNETNVTAPAKVEFTNSDRCLADCGTEASPTTANWPDVPFDLRCTAAPCNNNLAPSYWTTKRLTKISTKVWTGSGTTYKPVDDWSFVQDFPGGTDVPTLWLVSITRTGFDATGNTITLPTLTTHGRKDRNRADYDPNANMADPQKYRIDQIDTETGGRISVSYMPFNQPGDACTWWSGKSSSQWPNYDDNASRCFQQWITNRSGQSGWSWWHKLIVDKVTETDLVGSSPPKVTSYQYLLNEGAASNRPLVLWGYSTSWWASPKKAMSAWKGYPTVVTTVGTGPTQTVTKRIYYRGLDRDTGLNLPGEEFFRTSNVVDTEGGSVVDHQALAGQVREEIKYNGGAEITKTTDTASVIATSAGGTLPSWQTPPERYAYIARETDKKTYTKVADGTWRQTQIQSTWDGTYGVVTQVKDLGQVVPPLTADDLCTKYSYAMNIAAHLIDYPKQVDTSMAGNCSVASNYLIRSTRTSYDGAAYGITPTAGSPTKVEQLKGLDCGGVRPPCGTPTRIYLTETSKAFDVWGRVTSDADPLGNVTTTTYTHNGAGLLASKATTTPSPVNGGTGFTSTTTFDVLRGLPLTVTDPNGKVTTGNYDPLGRLAKVVKPGNTTGFGDAEYIYSISQSAAPYVQTRLLGPNGNQITSFDIYDGLLRPRQTQTTSPDGKRMITDTAYDDRGLKVKTSIFYNNASAPGSTAIWPTNGDADIDRQTRYTYDGAQRKTTEELFSRNVFKYKTQTVYEGDRTGVIPPLGGTVTQDVVDARGRVIEKRLYQSPNTLTGPFDSTTYAHDRLGNVTLVKDAALNQWSYGYDLLGRKTSVCEPDASCSTLTHDDAGNVISTEDGLHQKLFYEYDNLNRKTVQRADTNTGVIMAAWTYDTAVFTGTSTPVKGQPAMTSRYDGTDTYSHRIDSYDVGYRPTSTSDVIPGFGAGGGTLTYTTTATYKVNGVPATQVLPGVGGLPAETLTFGYGSTGLAQTLTGTWSGGSQAYINGIEYHYDGLVYRQYLGDANKRARLTTDYDPATRRLTQSWTSVETTTPGSFQVPYHYSYGYDNAGNITAIAGDVHGVADQEECFRYDYLRQLYEAWTQTSGACTTPQRSGADPYHRKWTYDHTGNRKTQQEIDTTNTDWTYTTGGTTACGGTASQHQLRQVTATGPLAGTATRNFCYDTVGNMIQRTTETGASQTLTWDKENHLKTVTDGGNTTSYLYNPDGSRLLAKTATKDTLYLPDGTELEKTNSNGSILGTRYYGNIGVRDAAGLKWLATNHQGSAVTQIDASTLTYQRRRFMPFGEPHGNQPTWTGTKGYVNGTKDSTGLTHLGAREYDPTTGRFVSVDPIADHADPLQMHGYAYSHNNPATFSDPSGLYDTCDNDGNAQCPPAPSPDPIPDPDPDGHGGGGTTPTPSGCYGGNRSPSCEGTPDWLPAPSVAESNTPTMVQPARPTVTTSELGGIKKFIVENGLEFLSGFLSSVACKAVGPALMVACGALVGAVLGGITYFLLTKVFGVKKFNSADLWEAIFAGLFGGIGSAIGGPGGKWIVAQLKSLLNVMVQAIKPKLARLGWAAAASVFVVVESVLVTGSEPARPANCPDNPQDPNQRKC